MRILLLTKEYPPHVYGGAGVHVEHLSRELERLEGEKHRVHVICFGQQAEQAGNLSVQGIDPGVSAPSREPRHGKFVDTLLRNVFMTGTAPEADIVHCHTWYTHLAGCLVKQLAGVPLVLTTHSLEPHRPWKEEQLGTAYRASTWLEETALGNADGIIAVSGAMKAAVQETYGLPPDRIRVIPNGIDSKDFKPTPDRSVLEAYRIRPDMPYLLFVGRLTRQKGILHLLNALPHLRSDLQAVLCAGEADTEEIGREAAGKVEEARRNSGARVVWISRTVPKRDLISLYTHASVFVCPSVYEPFGIINLEAMACETPVVATAVGGIPEVVVHDQTGLLVPFAPRGKHDFEPREPERLSRDLAAAVDLLLSSPQKAREFGRRGRRRVVEHFTWTRVAEQTLGCYRELVSAQGRTCTEGEARRLSHKPHAR